MTELAEIALAVAKALGSTDDMYESWTFPYDPEWMDTYWANPALQKDGGNLFHFYWRCRCLDWLLDRGDVGFLKGGQGAQFYVPGSDVGEEISLRCPAAEFPARAVAALMDRKE